MKQLLLLTKVFFNSSLDLSRKQKRKIGSYVYLLFAGLLFGALLASLAYVFFAGHLGKGLPKYGIVITCLAFLSVAAFMLNFLSMYSTLFKAKDFDFLASSPFKSSNIVIAKLLAVFIFSLIINFIAMLPVLIMYMIYGGTVVGFFATLVGIIFSGVIPLLLSTLFGALVALITAKLRRGDIIAIVLYSILFIGFATLMVFMFSSENFMANADKVLPYFKFLSKSMETNNGLGILWFILINIGASIVVTLFASLVYVPINQAKKNNGDGHYKSSKQNTSFTTSRFLFKKEVTMIVKNPLFLLSTYAMPLILFIVGIIFIGLIKKGFISHDQETLMNLSIQLNYYHLSLAILIAALSVPTYASFSMEGRENLEQLFVYPLDKRKIITAKIKASLIPNVAIFLVGNTLLVLILAIVQGFDKIPIWTFLNLIFIPALSCITATFIGTLCGLKWIKLDFVEANDVLKKSKAMGYTALISSLVNLGIFGVYTTLSVLLPKLPYLGFTVSISAEIVAVIVLMILVKKHSLKLLEKALIK